MGESSNYLDIALCVVKKGVSIFTKIQQLNMDNQGSTDGFSLAMSRQGDKENQVFMIIRQIFWKLSTLESPRCGNL